MIKCQGCERQTDPGESTTMVVLSRREVYYTNKRSGSVCRCESSEPCDRCRVISKGSEIVREARVGECCAKEIA